MLTFTQFFQSKTIWMTALMAIFNAVQAVHPVVPADIASQINVGLGAAIAAARVSNTQGQTVASTKTTTVVENTAVKTPSDTKS